MRYARADITTRFTQQSADIYIHQSTVFVQCFDTVCWVILQIGAFYKWRFTNRIIIIIIITKTRPRYDL